MQRHLIIPRKIKSANFLLSLLQIIATFARSIKEKAKLPRRPLLQFLAICERQAPVFAAAYLLTLAVYSYFFTTIIFVDHTFGNVWVPSFPSFRTTVVGRWFADILIFFVGNAGDQSFEMTIAAGISALNGILFALFIGLQRRLFVLLITLFICTHPAFLDYYSFTRDHIGFAFGDTLCLLGALALEHLRNRRFAMASAIVCFVLALAIYQPKISLIALLLIFWCMRGTAGLIDDGEVNGSSIAPMRYFLSVYALPAVLTFVAAVGLYWLSAWLVISRPYDLPDHNQVNDIGDILRQMRLAYPETFRNFTVRVDYLPDAIRFLPAFAFLSGLTILVIKAWQRHLVLGSAASILAALIPLALQISFIVNSQTPAVGRVLAPQAYCLLFFIGSLWLTRRLWPVATTLAVIFVYYFSIIGIQETNAAAMKQIFDVSKTNRLVSRIESVVPDTMQGVIPVVKIGYLEPNKQPSQRMLANNLFNPRVRWEFINNFCEPGIFNFFLGRQGLTLTRPTEAQVNAAIASQVGRLPWPASDSVYIHDGVIVILLERYQPGIPVTMSQEKFQKELPELQKFCG